MIRVRNATPRDASPIARVHVETWRDSYAGILPSHKLAGMSRRQHVGEWSQSLRTPRREIVLVAEDYPADGILGFGTAGRARTFSPPYEGEVYMLYVLPGFQDLGVGSALMKGLFEQLLRRKYRSGLLWVLADNPARFFYQTVGGKLIGRRARNRFGVLMHTVREGGCRGPFLLKCYPKRYPTACVAGANQQYQ